VFPHGRFGARPIAVHALFEDPAPVRRAIAGLALSAGDGEALYVRDPKLVAGWLTVLAMAGLGLSVDVRSVRAVGARVVVAVAGSLVVLIALAVALIRALEFL